MSAQTTTEAELFHGYRNTSRGDGRRTMAQAKNSPTVALARALELARTTPGDITDRVDGLSLRLYRTAAGVSSLAVAAAMGRSAQAISSIESRGASSDLAAEYLEAVDTAAGS